MSFNLTQDYSSDEDEKDLQVVHLHPLPNQKITNDWELTPCPTNDPDEVAKWNATINSMKTYYKEVKDTLSTTWKKERIPWNTMNCGGAGVHGQDTCTKLDLIFTKGGTKKINAENR